MALNLFGVDQVSSLRTANRLGPVEDTVVLEFAELG